MSEQLSMDATWSERGKDSRGGRRPSDFPWTAEQVEKLKRMWANNRSFSAIAAELGCSRNAAIGKAHRLGLRGPEPKLTIKKIPNPKRLRNATRIIAKINRHDPGINNYQSPTVEVVPLNLTFAQLQSGQCKYPYGDVNFLFCGQPAIEGLSYCGCHARLCYTAPSRNPAGNRQSLNARTSKFHLSQSNRLNPIDRDERGEAA